jgi:ribulose-phosphate 3-epimerase
LKLVRIAPSILSADFSCLAEQVQKIEAGGAEILHFDVMDGHFVPNLTFGPQLIRALRSKSRLIFDVHLMIERPERYLHDFVAAGADLLTVSAEACLHLHRILQQIRSQGIRAGVALNPATPLSALEYVLDELDLVLIMSVNPGFGGQEFIPAILPKITKLKGMLGGRPVEIAVDGGINPDNAALVAAAGATILVAGTAIFGAPDAALAIKMLQTEKKLV